MKTNYDKLTLTHNLSGVILPTERYENIYSNGDYLILPVIALYDDTIDKYATRTEVHQAEGKHEAKLNDRALYETANTSCKNFIMEVVDKTWYKELEDPDKFYTNLKDLKLLDHLTKFCLGLHTVDAVYIPQVMKTLFSDAEGIPQYINTTKAAQRKSKRAKIVINENYMHAVALKSLLQSGEYRTEIREWSNLPEDHKNWTARNTTFREAYVSKWCAEAAQEGEEKPFGGSAIFGAAPEKKSNEQLRRQVNQKIAGPVPITNQMMDFLEG